MITFWFADMEPMAVAERNRDREEGIERGRDREREEGIERGRKG